MKKSLLFIILIMTNYSVFAYDIAVENAEGVTIYYNYSNNGTELEVTNAGASSRVINYGTELKVTNVGASGYRGEIIIPETVTYMNRTRNVTSIGHSAFQSCSELVSISMGTHVKIIREFAFYGCKGLINLHIGSKVTTLERYAFAGCSSLNSLAIPNSVETIGEYAFSGCSSLNSIVLGESVTSIDNYAFRDCVSLSSINIGNKVKSIGIGAFYGCSNLTTLFIGKCITNIGIDAFRDCSIIKKVIIEDIASWCKINHSNWSSNPLYYAGHIYCDENTEIHNLIIPNSVTWVGGYAFYGCSGLTSVTIPNSVTWVGDYAFESCRGLTSVTIPNSVISIGNSAFESCSGLTSVTIPNSVTSIGSKAFYGWNFPTVVSLIENPFTISNDIFSKDTQKNATLYVPVGTIDKYKTTAGWKEFLFIEEGTGGITPTTPQKCEKPTIAYKNGKLTFNCETEGATCQSSITDPDITSYSSNEVQLGVTYNISVYATKTGFENSETTTATLCWIDVEPKTEGITNGISNVPANAVLIQSANGVLNISGVNDGANVSVYTLSGQMIGASKAIDNQTSIITDLQKGEIVIVKIGEKSVKVIMQ